MNVLILGDTHGNWSGIMDAVANLKQKPTEIWQVGDFGVSQKQLDTLARHYRGPRIRFIHGNHDNHTTLTAKHSAKTLTSDREVAIGRIASWYPDGFVRDGVLFIGGAQPRRGDFGRELNEQERAWLLDRCSTLYGKVHTVISHDCPYSIAFAMGNGFHSATRQLLEDVRQLLAPRQWFFGHHHLSEADTLDDCEWQCVGTVLQGDYVQIDTEELAGGFAEFHAQRFALDLAFARMKDRAG